MGDCVTDERIQGIIDAADPYQEWRDHFLSHEPDHAQGAIAFAKTPSAMQIERRYDGIRPGGRWYIKKGEAFVMEVTNTKRQAINVCKALGWGYTFA